MMQPGARRHLKTFVMNWAERAAPSRGRSVTAFVSLVASNGQAIPRTTWP